MDNPFLPGNERAYRAWCRIKLRDYPTSIDRLRISVQRLDTLSRRETAELDERVGKTNMALLQCKNDAPVIKESLVALGARLGLHSLDSNLCADEDAVSSLTVSEQGRQTEYIPYTNRPLGWHTDGYYNSTEQQVRAWSLLCAQDAAEGGENALLDHEILYILLRDEDPLFVQALMDPGVMTVPANRVGSHEIRPARVGPVFSIHPKDGSLHMRYSARAKNILWKQDATTQAALEFIEILFSSDTPYIFRHRLQPGECLLSNNVLHNRSGFQDSPGRKRLLFRARYSDRIRLTSGRVAAHNG